MTVTLTITAADGATESLVLPPAPTNVPVFGPNLIQLPTNYSGGGWSGKSATTLANQGTSIDGTNDLSKIFDDTTSDNHFFSHDQLNPQTAGNYTFSIYLKQGTLRYVQLALIDNNGFVYATLFDLQVGSITDTFTYNSPTGTSASIVSTSVSGLLLATITMDFSGGNQNLYPVISTSNSAKPTYNANGRPIYSGNSNYIYAWNASLRLSLGTVLAQQPWVTAGYLQNTFHSPAFTAANVDIGRTRNPGYQFYLHSAFSYPDTPSANVVLNANGSVTLKVNDSSNNAGASISPIAANRSGDVTKWIGTAFGGGAYFEATMSFDPNIINSANGANGFPAFWAEPVEHSCESSVNSDNWKNQVQWFIHFTEFDFFEYNVWDQDDRLFTYNGTVIDWSGAWNGATYPVNLQNSYNRRIQLSPDTDFTKPHRYGFLWVPATPTKQGYFQWFFDGLPTSDKVAYGYYDPVNPPAPPALQSSPWLYGVADSQHYQVLFNSDMVGSLTIYSMDVWQASATGNIVK